MAQDQTNFLRRWSRLKREASQPRAQAPAAPAELPALDELTFDSDFGAFMRVKVDEQVRRAALKKLFTDPRFNVMDGLDIYIDDYTKEDPIPAAMLAGLEHARTTLFGPPAGEEQEAAAGAESAPLASHAPSEEIPEKTSTSQDKRHDPSQADALPT